MFDENKAREDLKQILNTEEYRIYENHSKSFLENWWEKAKEWIADQLAKLFPPIESSANNAAGPILIAIVIAAIILLAIALFLIIRTMRRNRIHRDKKPLHSLKEINWPFQRHLNEAQKLEALEEYAPATRHLFLALLLYFHEKEWLEARIWKTNWEYYDELRKVNQQWADQFYNLASFFDEVTYGERKIHLEEYNQFRNQAIYWLDGIELAAGSGEGKL